MTATKRCNDFLNIFGGHHQALFKRIVHRKLEILSCHSKHICLSSNVQVACERMILFGWIFNESTDPVYKTSLYQGGSHSSEWKLFKLSRTPRSTIHDLKSLFKGSQRDLFMGTSQYTVQGYILF